MLQKIFEIKRFIYFICKIYKISNSIKKGTLKILVKSFGRLT